MDKKSSELLRYIQDHPGVRYLDVLNAFDSVNQAVSIDRRLKELIKRGYLAIPTGAIPPDCLVELTYSGFVAQEEYKEHLAQQKTDTGRFIATMTIGVLSLIAGLTAAVAAVLALFPR